jgi:maleylacetate reductase
MSIIGSSAGVHKGASHGIGHVLGGTAGVPHGYTSCVMLPHVMRYNHSVNAEQQKRVSEALGEPQKPAGELLAELVAELGLPSTLREVGVPADMLDLIAQNAMHDRLIHTNPRKIHGPEDVRSILDAAW